jgi:hypothetical protein
LIFWNYGKKKEKKIMNTPEENFEKRFEQKLKSRKEKLQNE